MDSDSVLLPQLPVIDFSDQNLKPGSSKWVKVRSEVRKAVEEYGCFEASFANEASTKLKNTVFETLEELFDLPIETKKRNVSPKPIHGYLCHGLTESLAIDDANDVENVNHFTQQLWPDQGNKRISETIQQFTEKYSEVDVMVRRMVMESFGIENYIDEHLNSSYYLFRMMKYTPDDVEETHLGLISHTDKNIMTIIHQYDVDGLEIQTKDEKWIRVKPSQDCFLVMVGDSLCALLNGRLSSPQHRVRTMGKKTRYSTVLFSVPNEELIIDSPHELVDEDHPRLFKPFKYSDFRNFFDSEVGPRARSTLHAFAAI